MVAETSKTPPAYSRPSRNVFYLHDQATDLIYTDLIKQEFELPVPPPECRQYGESSENHLAGGKRDADKIRSILAKGEFDIRHCKRFLDWGCSNGRVLRHFIDWAQQSEAWGTDINALTAM